MLELDRREGHLLGAVWFQVLLIALIVFAFTQAVRQLNYEKERQGRLQEQVVMAREQVSKQAMVRQDLSSLQEEVADLRSHTVPVSELPAVSMRIKELAEQKFNLTGVQLKMGDSPVETLDVPIHDRQNQRIDLYMLNCMGQGSSRRITEFLAYLHDSNWRPLMALSSLDCQATESIAASPVAFTAQWAVAISPEAPEHKPVPEYSVSVEWGNRLEPFRSPMEDPSVYRPAPAPNLPLLTGLNLDPVPPLANLDGHWVKPGEQAGAYRVLYIGKTGVLLQDSKGKEQFLPAPETAAHQAPSIG